MLEIKNISKKYVTATLEQIALDNVSINFRSNEFVAILGPSGSGKTTLLNIIGGLDHYDTGDLIINGVSTKKYKDRDWDSYRNHRIGFVFQSYNLIMHQSVLSNVELAMTLSGVNRKERNKRAKEALKSVALEKHMHKKPSQLSGGQMQRVAIARALVNNPDILLADEPTGALDSETSIQIMNLLKEVAKDRLVVMVTHNPDLANEYANRIIKLKDGKIIDDSNPYKNQNENEVRVRDKKVALSMKTAFGLSLNNLMTKKGRTFLTAFAGSIGIIGIALILALSNGMQDYINKTEKETLANYPLTINKNATNYFDMMTANNVTDKECEENKICVQDDITNNTNNVVVKKNNLSKFIQAINDNYHDLSSYISNVENGFNLNLEVYDKTEYIKVNNQSIMQTMSSSWKELSNNQEMLSTQYQLVSGKMPANSSEVVLVVNYQQEIPASLLYALRISPDLNEFVKKAILGEKIELNNIKYNYDNIIGKKYKLVLATDYYIKESNKWINQETDEEYLKKIVDAGTDLTIVGIIKPTSEDVNVGTDYVGYKTDLTQEVINKINASAIVKEQKENKAINIFTGKEFDNIDSYESNLEKLGSKDLSNPDTINIYPKNYDAKAKIKTIIDEYNNEQNEEDKISYTDYVGELMKSITSIVNIITYVLVAFVAISLVVSSIMIAIITYISVLERIKEIGILRAIGASKKDITKVFNAETMIEGMFAGILGIFVTWLLCMPISKIIENISKVPNMAVLPWQAGLVLILISTILTIISGLIPAKIASKKDPVESLRSE